MSKPRGQIVGAAEIYNTSAKKKKEQPATSEAEKMQRRAEKRTQGRTGCKMSRINFALTVENDNYVRLMSRARAENMTDFINHCIEEHRANHEEAFNDLMKFRAKT